MLKRHTKELKELQLLHAIQKNQLYNRKQFNLLSTNSYSTFNTQNQKNPYGNSSFLPTESNTIEVEEGNQKNQIKNINDLRFTSPAPSRKLISSIFILKFIIEISCHNDQNEFYSVNYSVGTASILKHLGKNFYEHGSLVLVDDANKSQIGYNQLVSIVTENIIQITSPRGDTLGINNNVRKTPKEKSKLCAPTPTTSNNTSATNNAHQIVSSYNNVHGSYIGSQQIPSNMQINLNQINLIEPILIKQNSNQDVKKVPKLGLEKVLSHHNQDKSPSKLNDRAVLIDKQDIGFSQSVTDKIQIEKLVNKELRIHIQEKNDKVEKIDKQNEIKNEKEKNDKSEKLVNINNLKQNDSKPPLPISSNTIISNFSAQNNNNTIINQSSTKTIMNSNMTIKISLKLNSIAPEQLNLNKSVINPQQSYAKLVTSPEIIDEEKIYESQILSPQNIFAEANNIVCSIPPNKPEEIGNFFEIVSNNSSDKIDTVNHHEYQKSQVISSNHEDLTTYTHYQSKGIISTSSSQQNESKRSYKTMKDNEPPNYNFQISPINYQHKCTDKPISTPIILDQRHEISNGINNLNFTPSLKNSIIPESKLVITDQKNEFNKELLLKDDLNLIQVKEKFSLLQVNKNLSENTPTNNILLNESGSFKFFE